MKYGLSEEIITKITNVFASFSEIEKVVIYGSRAKGSHKLGSDIDFVLYGKDLNSDLCANVAEKLDDLLLPYTIDLSVFDTLEHTDLCEHIKRVGKVFYERCGNSS